MDQLLERATRSFSLTFGDETISYAPFYQLRYGANPHQSGTLYVSEHESFRIREVKTGKGGLSLGNVEDVFRAANLLKYFPAAACAVMKHCNPTGVASSPSITQAFHKAWHCDPVAAYGSVVGFSAPVTEEMMRTLVDKAFFIEVVAAPSFEPGAVGACTRKNMRLVELINLGKMPKFTGDRAAPWLKSFGGMIAIEDQYLTRFRTPDELMKGVVTATQPPVSLQNDLLFAWYVCGSLRSNAVAIVKDQCTVACGTGQPDRVRAITQAVQRTREMNRKFARSGYELDGAVLASDGYFPFADSIQACADAGIAAIVQPGGSIRDKEVIDAANEAGIAMIFTGERCFSHH